MKDTAQYATRLAAVLLSTLLSASASADLETKSQGELGLETRAFIPTPNATGDEYNVAMVGRLSLTLEAGPVQTQFRGFGRLDAVDDDRTALFPEEAWIEFKQNPLRIRLGYQLLNWTATEAFHPADVINSRYFDGNVQNPEKLGELMASLRLKFLNGNIEGYFLPLFTEPILPSTNSRFRFAPLGTRFGETLVIDQNGEVSDDRWFLRWAARVQQTFGGMDISVHAMQHIDRQLPLVVLNPTVGIPQVVYQHVTQVGGTYQHVLGPFIVKVEAAWRKFAEPDDRDGLLGGTPIPNRDHTLVAVGLEYGFGHGFGGESTFLLEGQNAFGLEETDSPSLLLFQRDVLAGYRLSVGDESDQTLTISGIMDIDAPEQVFGNLEYSRRIGETWRTQVGVRVISFPPEDESAPVGPEYLDQANYGYVNLLRYF